MNIQSEIFLSCTFWSDLSTSYLFKQVCRWDEQAYYFNALRICKLQLLVIFDKKSSFEDGKLEAVKVADFGANINFTITFTQERCLRVYFDLSVTHWDNEKLGIKEMLNSTLVLCTLYRCLGDWIPPKEEASQQETLVIIV